MWRAGYEAFGRAGVSADPDGNPVTADPGIDFNIRFPGQYFDAETGLHYNRFRYYDPNIGRYVSADPIGQFGLIERSLSLGADLSIGGRVLELSGVDGNVFAYVRNMPTVLVDPSGLLWFSSGQGASGGAGPAKGTSSGSYWNPGTGSYGTYTSTDVGVSTPGASGTTDFAVGAGSDPSGTTYYGSGSYNFFGLQCNVSVGSGDNGLSFKFSFGAGWPPRFGAGSGKSNTSATHKGNVYRNLRNALSAPYRTRGAMGR